MQINKVTVHGLKGSEVQRFKVDGLVKSLQCRHSRKACPRPDRGAGVHKWLSSLDSHFRRNDENGRFLTFCEFVKIAFLIQDPVSVTHLHERRPSRTPFGQSQLGWDKFGAPILPVPPNLER